MAQGLSDMEGFDLELPRGWRRRETALPMALYRRKRLRLGASKTRGVLTVSISKEQRGRPTAPTDAECEQVLAAFGITGMEEITTTSGGRYFRPSTKDAS